MPEAPIFSTRTPDVLNSANVLSFAMPVINTGTGVASNIVLKIVARLGIAC